MMILIGIFLILIAIKGIRISWKKNEWRLPLFEVHFRLIGNNAYKMRPKIFLIGLCLMYILGTIIIYYAYQQFWVLIVLSCIGFWVLKAVYGLFRASYSQKIRLLNYLYSPYFWAWKRDHWAQFSDKQIACAVCKAICIDSTLVSNSTTLDDFLFKLCQKTRSESESKKYLNALKIAKEESENMYWKN